MLELKTKLSSIKLDENVTISKKGKYPLEIERKKLFIDYLSAQENSLDDAYQYSDHYSDYILNDDAGACDDCGEVFYSEDLEEGSDGCYYCSECIHEHLEDEEEIA